MRKRLMSLGMVTLLALGSVGMAGCDKEDRPEVGDVTNDEGGGEGGGEGGD
jgi:hypothetical protein